MTAKYHQISLKDTFSDCQDLFVDDALSFFQLLNEHFDIQEFIPSVFHNAFYQHFGRKRDYPLESFLSALILQKIFSIPSDSLLLLYLRLCRKLREFRGFSNVPDAPLLTRFKQNFAPYIELMFEQMVGYTEPICQLIDSELAQILTFDTSTSTALSAMPTSSPSLPTGLVLSATLSLSMTPVLKRIIPSWRLKRRRIPRMKTNPLVTLPPCFLSFPTSFPASRLPSGHFPR